MDLNKIFTILMRSLITISSIILTIVVINLFLNICVIMEFLKLNIDGNKETPSISDIHLHGSMFLGNFSLIVRIIDFKFIPKFTV